MIDAHRLGEERSIAMHAAIGELLRADPTRLRKAKLRVQSWLAEGSVPSAYAEQWQAILSRPLDAVIQAIIDPSQEGRALRQVSPFAGFLAPRERWRIRREVAQRMGVR